METVNVDGRAIFYPVERRGGCWGWFEDRPHFATPHFKPANARTKKECQRLRSAAIERESASVLLANINPF